MSLFEPTNDTNVSDDREAGDVRNVSTTEPGVSASEAKPIVNTAADFYITEPTWKDKVEIRKLADIPNFLFAPFNNPIDERQLTPDEIANRLVYGSQDEVIRAVRLKEEDMTAGIVRFEKKPFERKANGEGKTQPRWPTEISYFFHPKYHNRGLGTGAVLRALDWYINTHSLSQNRYAVIIATVDPNNRSSVSILKRAGLQLRDIVESPYADSYGERRPRIVMEGNVQKHILPALRKAREEGYYMPHAEASRLIEQGFLAVSEAATSPKRHRRKGMSSRRHASRATGNDSGPVEQIALGGGGGWGGEFNAHHRPFRPNLPYLQGLNWSPRR